jgi:hypothetical protein
MADDVMISVCRRLSKEQGGHNEAIAAQDRELATRLSAKLAGRRIDPANRITRRRRRGVGGQGGELWTQRRFK